MATLKELSFRILESIRGEIGAEENIDIREIEYDITNTRALLLRNELNKNRTVSSSIIQSLGCIEIETLRPQLVVLN